MKLVITEPGFKGYTGQMGVLEFVDGISTTDVLPHDAIRMSAVMGFEWEDGTPASVAQHLLDRFGNPAETVEVKTAAPEPQVPVEAAKPVVQYTAEQLADIADKSGIAGLRDIAEPLGLKGNSINGLIAAILKVGASA